MTGWHTLALIFLALGAPGVVVAVIGIFTDVAARVDRMVDREIHPDGHDWESYYREDQP